ncbi:protein lava lamp [Eucalyptus grandis]|uniref:protein lava lamp n=1 Tax=Eucalyptus grandis TaxID=71139 RepID=UPI00192E97B8|nr:protein lava lamp [Eucalyptus grandis]
MTGDVDAPHEASVEVASVNGKIDEKCGADAGAQQDLVKSVGDCNGVPRRREEEAAAVDNGIENGNGNGEDDADGAYVFVKGSEAVGEDVGNGFAGTDLREESVEGKASDIDLGGSKVGAENGNCDVEQAAVNRENGDREGKLVNRENGDRHFDDHTVVNEVELVEQEGNDAHIKENNGETVVETHPGHGKVVDLNDGECRVEDHLMDNGSGMEDSQGEFIKSTLAGSTSAQEQNCEADTVESAQLKQHKGECHIEKQPAAESSLEVSDEFLASCDATVVASRGNATFEVPQADEVDSSGQMGGDQKSLEVQPSLEISEELSGSCDVIVVASEYERASEVPQADQADSSGQVDEDQKSELKMEDSREVEVLKIDDGAGNEDEKVMEERKSCPDVETEQNHEPKRTFEVPHADQTDSSGQVDENQKSELTIVDSGEGEVSKIDDGAGNEDEKVMEERKSRPDIDTEQIHEPERTFEVLQADQADSSGQVDEDQKSELKIEDSGKGEVLEIDDGAGEEDEKVMEGRKSCPDIETEQNLEPERTFEVPQADQADSSGQVDEDQKSELTIVDSGEREVSKIDDGTGNEDEKVVEERKSCPDIDTEQNHEPERTFEVLQDNQADSSGQVDEDQKSELKIEDSGKGEVLKIDDGAGEEDEKVMEDRKSCPDIETEQNLEPERTLEVPQADHADSSGQVDEDQKSELTIVDSGEREVSKIDDGAGNKDENVMEERKSCPDGDTEQNHEPERTFEVPQADQADSSGQVDEDQKSELTIVDSGDDEVGKIDDRVGNKDEKVMEESISCPDIDTEQNPEPQVILTKDFGSDKEKSSTKMGDDFSSEAAPEDISMKSSKFATAELRAGPFSDDTGDVEPTATAPDPIASENAEHEAVMDALDAIQEINEEAHASENTEITPSSASCVNVPVHIELEEVNSEEKQTGIPQCVNADLEVREENDSTVVDVTSSCSATNLSAITEICFGSIGQKEISSIPLDHINAEPKVSNSQSAGSHHTHTTECLSNDTAEYESFAPQNSKSGLKNELDAVLDEKREDQSTIENDKPAFSRPEGVDVVAQNDAAPAEVSSIPASEEQNVGSEVEKKLFNVLVKIPRYDDENSKQQINEAQLQVTEKTQSRDAIQAEIQIIKAACKEHNEKVDVALSQENAARELSKSKRDEIDSVQSVINKVKNAITVGDYDVRIQNMEQKIQHETLPLKEEKQLVRDIKQLKCSREQLTNNMGGLDELKLALDQREQTEEQLKSLRKEADSLRENVSKAEAVTKSAKRKYSEERERLRELQGRFRDADKIRQEAYIHLKNLRKQSYEKNKYFWKYKDDVKMSIDLASKGDREALSQFCIDQVETFMELWNRSNDFREEYLRCNAPRTLRRLGTADGRSLGPDEAMPAIPLNQTAVKDKSMPALPSIEREKVTVVVEARPAADDKLPVKEVEQKKQKAKNKSSAKPVTQVEDLVAISSRDVVDVEIEEPKLSKEEEELAKKAEELRKAEEAAILMEQRRLEEKAKAKEALERKKRIAERAQARAALKAQKEAEQKEKEREKKAKKKERKKAGGAIAMPSDAGIEGETASSSEVTAEALADFDAKDKPAATVKRPQKPLHFVKQTKVKPIPPPLRNRGKRKMQPWMWAVLSVVLVFALFLVSNGWNLF